MPWAAVYFVPSGMGPNDSSDFNEIRLPAPVPVDSRARARAEVAVTRPVMAAA